ncbi:hypothetical protein CBL_05537 [Carabus blaptoides fortunei]
MSQCFTPTCMMDDATGRDEVGTQQATPTNEAVCYLFCVANEKNVNGYLLAVYLKFPQIGSFKKNSWKKKLIPIYNPVGCSSVSRRQPVLSTRQSNAQSLLWYFYPDTSDIYFPVCDIRSFQPRQLTNLLRPSINACPRGTTAAPQRSYERHRQGAVDINSWISNTSLPLRASHLYAARHCKRNESPIVIGLMKALRQFVFTPTANTLGTAVHANARFTEYTIQTTRYQLMDVPGSRGRLNKQKGYGYSRLDSR